MRMEFPGSSNQQLGRDRFNGEVGCGNNTREDSICSQTGEEFSNQFLRDFGAQRRVQGGVTRNVEGNHNNNRHLVYEDFNRILGLQRVDSNISEGMNSSSGYFAESNVTDSPRMKCQTATSDVYLPEILKLLCSFGGRILQRPGDGKLRYIGGETRIISIRKHVGLNELMQKTYALCNSPHTIKYQLPGEDLDALISVCSDEDLLHMIEEYQEAETKAGSQRIRVFLVSSTESSESPKIFNERNMNINRNTHQQMDIDHYHYVSALNGVVDVSPQKSSSGQSGTSQTTQFGNASEFSPTFHHRDSPTSVHTWENKDCNSPTFMNPYMNTNAVHFMPKMQIPRNSFGQPSPPSSPFPVHKRANTDVPYFVDQNSFFENNNRPYYVSPNFQQQHRFLFETTTQTNKHPEMNLHDRRPSDDIYPHCQAYSGPEKVMLKKNALSDPQLHDESQINNGLEAFTKQPWKILRKNLHVVATSQWEESDDIFFKKPEGKRSKELELTKETPNSWMDRDPSPGSFDQASKKHGVSNNNSSFSPNFFSHDYQPAAQVTSSDSQDSGSSVFSLSVNNNENHLDCSKDKFNGFQRDMSLDILIRKNTSATDQLCSTTKSSDQADYSSPNTNFPVNYLRQEPMIPRCDLERNSDDSEIQGSLPREESFHYCGMPLRKVGSREATFLHTQESDDFFKNKLLGPQLIVEDVTNEVTSDALLSATIVPQVHSESDDDHKSCTREKEIRNAGHESATEEKYRKSRNTDDSFSEAAMVEIEAGIYGLQIIKNPDLEDLHELGSGTFGTVYYGKWRGTDVAIKRIKNSCFSGGSSEQARQTKDFWREARILANLHHPNVVAFYGVVPDGPGGTMATVTEYMVNGSLRHVLQRKDRSLDRRKKLMITLDAAFGMEYLHMKNIVHFDLKCDNLLVNLRDTQRPICKVGDFGLSRIKRNTLVSGGVRGTLPWMAPELLNGSSNRVSEKVDVFSFGIAMWEILTGEEPYANLHCGAIIGGIVNNTLRPPVPERCEAEWRKLMEQCWSFDPGVRPSFTEIVDRLRSMTVALQHKRRT
ncbi:Serine/threonine-protein kinase EDR1 [Cardamine amara subsp. amara]|uniref:Serine/threonine-protein kinase EDR1 n=1 Tax=Cardamine amara subsp. amara TaxID=228776 RepID=A0ABD0Z236_CARAN